MNFGVPNAQTGCKFYYGKMGETVVNQENFWKRATKREWKIKGAKEAGFADVIDQRKIDQMRAFLQHRGASRASSRRGGKGPNVQAQGDSGYNDLGDPPRPNSQESRVTGMSRLSDFTRATGWKSRASLGSGSSVSSELLKELLESNLALKEEFGNLKSEMMRTTNRLAQMEVPVEGETNRSGGSRLGRSRTRTPMIPK